MTRHIAIDVRMARDSGIGTYIRHLVPRLIAARPHWTFTLLGHREALDALDSAAAPNVGVRTCTSRIYSVAEHLELGRAIPRDADLFWAPHYNIPLLYRGPLVVTVHDVFHLAMTQYVHGMMQRAYARGMFAAVARRAKAVLTVSEFSRQEYHRHVGMGGADPVVVHNGVDEAWLAARTVAGAGGRPLPRPYVICVGNIKPHKNLGALVTAFAQVAPRVPHDLVVVGRREGLRSPDLDIGEFAARQLGDRVHFIGEVDDDTLRRYMAHAALLVSASVYEGFGLPPLEAMAVGCPAAVSRAAAFPEVCGDAATYFDPTDRDDIARAIHEALIDEGLRMRLIERGRARARSFTWERSAAGTLEVLEWALTRP